MERTHLLIVHVFVICAIHALLANGFASNRNERERNSELLDAIASLGGQERSGDDYQANTLDQEPKKPDPALGLMTVFGSPSVKAKSPPIEDEAWKGKWFPTTPGTHRKKELLAKDEHGRVQMGVSSSQCDDGQTNLTLDWDESPVNYTCFHPETRYPIGPLLEPTLDCVNVPEAYRPDHFCMDKPIHYDDNIPSFGDHRPLWPVFGEYVFVPRQRWLHNIEHGAVVMLYHPCAHPMEVKLLKDIVRDCYDKHVITPSNLLTHERPLALVAWGCKLEMSTVDTATAQEFIRQKAFHGPEGKYTKEGQFYEHLLHFSNETGYAVYDRITC